MYEKNANILKFLDQNLFVTIIIFSYMHPRTFQQIGNYAAVLIKIPVLLKIVCLTFDIEVGSKQRIGEVVDVDEVVDEGEDSKLYLKAEVSIN